MHTLRLSVAAFMLAAVGAAVALRLAQKGGAGRQGDPLRAAARAGRSAAGRVTKSRGAASRRRVEQRPAAGGARAGDRADLRSRSQDMVSEGGPAGEPHSQDP